MALKSRLGFGMMRLPVKNGNPTDFDYEELNRMVDTFIEAGYTYFDTSYVYHDGKSEEATRKAVVERYPRDAFTVATKFPTFSLEREDQIEPIFAKQLENLGVKWIDYYLLHNFQTVYYDGIDGKGGIVKTAHLFDHANKWKEEGKIKHLGFSFGLSMVPAAVEKRLKEMNPNASIASWAIRYAGSFDGVICNLSGMSTLEQVQDNINSVQNLEPLSTDEMAQLHEIVKLYKAAGPIGADLEKYRGLTYHGAPVTAILEAYNMCQLQPDPGFADDNNYLKNTVAEEAHLDFFGKMSEEKVVLADGTDVTETVKKAESWLIEHSF